MKLTNNESSEDYLETILMLSERLPVVRSIDIAEELNFSKASVSVAMKNLKAKNMIVVSNAGFITLTPAGEKIASSVYERHTLLSSWLQQLGVDLETASNDACRMEHVISEESFNAIKRHIHVKTSTK